MDPIPTPPQSLQSHKFPLFPILLVLLVLLLTSTSYLFYQNLQLKKQIIALQISPIPPISQITPTATINPTENWKMYTNDKYGFSVKYPAEMNVNVDNKNDFLRSLITFENKSEKIFVYIAENNAGYNEINKDIDMFGGGKINSLKESTSTVNNHPIKLVSYTTELNKKITTAVIENNKMVIGIYAPQNLFSQILSTFQFIEPSTTTYTCPPNGWVDCMPGQEVKPECSEEAMDWYKTNCPDFKGGAF